MMDYMGLKQKDLIPFFESKSTTSKILSCKAHLTLKHIWILSKELNFPVQLLAKPYRVDDWGFMKKFDKSITNQIKANA